MSGRWARSCTRPEYHGRVGRTSKFFLRHYRKIEAGTNHRWRSLCNALARFERLRSPSRRNSLQEHVVTLQVDVSSLFQGSGTYHPRTLRF